MADENGTPAAAPPTPEVAAVEAVPVAERLMGLFGVAVAIGIGLIGLDLMTGGGVSRLFGRGAGDDG